MKKSLILDNYTECILNKKNIGYIKKKDRISFLLLNFFC